MGGYNTPESRHNGRDRSVKVGHEIKTVRLNFRRTCDANSASVESRAIHASCRDATDSFHICVCRKFLKESERLQRYWIRSI